MKRAQGTIEYLVIIAIIVVIGLLVVGLMATGFSQTGQINQKTGNLPSITSPISILDSAVDGDGNGLFVLQNNEGQNLTITKITLNGEDNNYNTQFTQGDELSFLLNNLTQCQCSAEDTTKTCTIIIYYTTSTGITKSYTHTIRTDCIDNITPNPKTQTPTPTEDTTPPIIYLLSPSNNDINQNSKIQFDFNVSDETSISDCTLYINGVDVNSNPTFTSATDGYFDFNFAANNYSDAIYDWNITCNDGTNTGSPDTNRQLNLDLNNYELTYCLELQDMNQNLSANYILNSDINCYADTHEDGALWNNGAGFSPVGLDAESSFSGSFNGNEHTITGLYINRSDIRYVGLFGSLTNSTITRVGLVDVNINCVYSGTGFFACGALAGNWGPADGSTLSNSFVTGTVSGRNYTGGLVGSGVLSLIENCYSKANVTGERFVGGLIGNVDSLVINSFATGSINASVTSGGGLIGVNSQDYFLGEVRNSFATGQVTGSTVGGLVGSSATTDSITNSYWHDNLVDDADYCIAYSGDTLPEDCAGEEEISYFQGTSISSNPPFSSWTFGVDANWVEVANDYPKLAWEN